MRRLLVCAVCLFTTVSLNAAAPSLLGDGQVKLLMTRLSSQQATLAKSLIDGDTQAVSQPVSEAIEFVIELPELSSPKTVRLHQRKSKASKGSAEIELWGSIESADTGFQLLRSATVQAGQKRVSFNFLPAAARWLLIRVAPIGEQTSLPLAEIEVLGESGAPVSKYAFQDSPADAQAVLAKLRSVLSLKVSEPEHALLADAADGRLENWSLADAALLASGVVDENERQLFRKRIDDLEQAARRATEKATDPMARSQALLDWLHREVLIGGYSEQQTDLSVLITQGTFNCVSSAVMFGLLAKRLEIDVRGIEVPDHAYAIVYDGTRHADVETTSARGFDPSRNRAAMKAFTQRTGFVYIPDAKASKRRETSMLGLVALIYYNHGVEHSRAGRHEQALLAYYRALSLDSGLASAIKNSLVALNRWAQSEADNGDYERAIALLGTGLTLAPKDRALRHNRRVIWQRRITATSQDGSPEQVLAVVKAAHLNDPDAGFDRQQAAFYIQRGRVIADAGQWAEAIAVTAPAVGQINDASLRSLQRFQASVFSRWLIEAIDARQWDDALKAAVQAKSFLPKDNRLRGNAAYLLQEWGEDAVARQGDEAGIEAVRAVLAVYPKAYQVKRAARSFVARRLKALEQTADFSQALRTAKQSLALLPPGREQNGMIAVLINQRARLHVDAKRWRRAFEIYREAAAHLTEGQMRASFKNVPYLAQEWLKGADNKASEVAGELMATFGDIRKVRQVVSTHFQRQVLGQQELGEFEAGVTAAKDAQAVLGETAEAKKLLRIAYEQWAGHLRQQQDWAAATRVYDRALQQLPNDSRLKRNAIATWHAWAEPYMNNKQWLNAIDIYERGLEKLPNASLFKKNIRYCRQQLAR